MPCRKPLLPYLPNHSTLIFCPSILYQVLRDKWLPAFCSISENGITEFPTKKLINVKRMEEEATSTPCNSRNSSLIRQSGPSMTSSTMTLYWSPWDLQDLQWILKTKHSVLLHYRTQDNEKFCYFVLGLGAGNEWVYSSHDPPTCWYSFCNCSAIKRRLHDCLHCSLHPNPQCPWRYISVITQ